jgi:hypothetical protein
MPHNEAENVFSMHMYRIPIIITLAVVFFGSCRKTELIDAGPESVRCSADTIRFDTVFTTAGSATTGFLIFNLEDQPVSISAARLARGNASMFQMNIDGVPGPVARQIRIEARDSIYVFVTVRIDPDAATNPFLIRDSLLIELQGRTQSVILEAWGQNARFLRNVVITGDTRFDRTLPYVILGGLQIARNARLTIEPGSRIHLHADAPILVDGSLVTRGSAAEPVTFTGDRLDEGYRNLPASWPGIYLRASSTDNRLTHARILNAYNGIVAEGPSAANRPKLILDRCLIDNAYEAGIAGSGSSIEAENCQVSNCGKNILLLKGGEYLFKHCTVASFSHALIPHKYPVFTVQNWDSTRQGVTTYPVSVQVDNSIIWGDEGTVEQEFFTSRRGANPFQVNLRNCLFRGSADPANAVLTNGLRNQPPQFDSINTTKRYFDFRIRKKLSPALNRGLPGLVVRDLDDMPRDAQPDLGAYERQ